jgi:hypothetical protein
MIETSAASLLPAVGVSDLEAEHALQYKLLAEAERLLESEDRAAARDVIAQLHSYSDAHFASEQVLMRLRPILVTRRTSGSTESCCVLSTSCSRAWTRTIPRAPRLLCGGG